MLCFLIGLFRPVIFFRFFFSTFYVFRGGLCRHGMVLCRLLRPVMFSSGLFRPGMFSGSMF